MDPFAELGTYYAVNPFKSDTSRTAENVSRFLYTMLEHDGISKEQQLAIYRNANLPIKALVDTGGKLPVIVSFVDTDEHVSRVLPHLKEMAAHRLIVRENVVVEQGSLD